MGISWEINFNLFSITLHDCLETEVSSPFHYKNDKYVRLERKSTPNVKSEWFSIHVKSK